jgi:hypothetical protein
MFTEYLKKTTADKIEAGKRINRASFAQIGAQMIFSKPKTTIIEVEKDRPEPRKNGSLPRLFLKLVADYPLN